MNDGGNIEAMSETGATPLILASLQGRHATVKLLLSKGAQVNHEMPDGYVDNQNLLLTHDLCFLQFKAPVLT